ncbi:MAG: hypothetical protein ABSE47_04510, partial [Acidimicrobiales bacterium]
MDAVAPQAIDGALDVPADGRLLAVEPEFRSVLSVCKREGSTLSSILRQSWDGGRLQARSRARTAVADDTHVSVLGHITSHELRAGLAESDAYGGLLNRFLIVEAHRSKLLPDGGNLDDSVIAHLGSVIASV